MHIVATLDASMSRFAAQLRGLADNGRAEMAAALNAGGLELRHRTVDAETKQTGLPHDTIERAQSVTEAGPATLSFTISSAGGNVRLKYFGAKEGGGGVTAHPWNASRFYAGAFLTSGWHVRKMAPKLNGHVFERIGSKTRTKFGNLKIRQVKSGLFIPDEMVKGGTASAFDGGARQILDTVVEKLAAQLP